MMSMRTRPPGSNAPQTTEEQARITLVAALHRLRAGGLDQVRMAAIVRRWRRSAGDGYLVLASAAPKSPGPDDVIWIHATTTVDSSPVSAQSVELAVGALQAVASASCALIAAPEHAAALACLPSVQRAGIPAFHPVMQTFGGDDLRCAMVSGVAANDTRAGVAAVTDALGTRTSCLIGNLGALVLGDHPDATVALAEQLEGMAAMYATLMAIRAD